MARPLAGRALLVLGLAACHLRASRPELQRLQEEGEVWVYLRALPAEAGRLSVAIASVAASRAGSAAPLEVRLGHLGRASAPGQRLLAWGRLPPGSYEGLQIGVARASLSGEEGPMDLLVAQEPVFVPAPLVVSAGRVALLELDLRYREAVQGKAVFTPAFAAFSAARPIPQLVGYVSNEGGATLTAFDRQRRAVGDVVATGAAPRGLALDAAASRAYVAASGEDVVEVVDVGSGALLPPLRLRPGDRPAEVALASDARTLVVTAEGANAVVFLDTVSGGELARLPVGDGPRGLTLDRAGQRAYVLDRRSNAIDVLDVPNRAAVATVATEPSPSRAAVSRDGSRLYVIAAGSAYLTAYALPGLAVLSRAYVGLGARSVLVDARTDLVYVGGDLSGRLLAFDAFSLIPVDQLELPGEVVSMCIADADGALFALLADRRQVAVLDLVSRAILAVLDVGREPYQIVVAGQRR